MTRVIKTGKPLSRRFKRGAYEVIGVDDWHMFARDLDRNRLVMFTTEMDLAWLNCPFGDGTSEGVLWVGIKMIDRGCTPRLIQRGKDTDDTFAFFA